MNHVTRSLLSHGQEQDLYERLASPVTPDWFARAVDRTIRSTRDLLPETSFFLDECPPQGSCPFKTHAESQDILEWLRDELEYVTVWTETMVYVPEYDGQISQVGYLSVPRNPPEVTRDP